MKLWQGAVLAALTVVFGRLVANTWPSFPVIGAVGGICFMLGYITVRGVITTR